MPEIIKTKKTGLMDSISGLICTFVFLIFNYSGKVRKMKKILFALVFAILASFANLFSQATENVSVYLITCGPGTATYSIYGHSALANCYS